MDSSTGMKIGGLVFFVVAVLIGLTVGGYHLFGSSSTETNVAIIDNEDSTSNKISSNTGPITVNNNTYSYHMTLIGVIFISVLIFVVIITLGLKFCSHLNKVSKHELASVRIQNGREENSPKPEITETRHGTGDRRTQSVCSYPFNPSPMPYSNFQGQGVYHPSAPVGYNHTNQYITSGAVNPYMGPSMGTIANPTATKNTVSIGVPQVPPKTLSEELSESQRQREVVTQENLSLHARLLDLQSRIETVTK